MYQKSNPFLYSLIVFCLSILSEVSLRFSENSSFNGAEVLTLKPPTPSLENQVFLFVWVITFDLSGMGEGGGALPIATLPPA